MDTPIKNASDLRSEIFRLKALEQEQSLVLKERFSSPSAIFASFFSMFPKSPTVDGAKSAGFFDQDFLGLISRFVLPLTLNKTIFKNSNFLIKALVGLLSQKASKYISEDSVVSIWDKMKSAFTRKVHKDAIVPRDMYAYSEVR